MLVVNKLNLEPGWGYRLAPPKGQFKFEFQLDEESVSKLNDALGNCRTEKEIEQFEDAINQSVYLAICTIDRQEFSEKHIPPYTRLVIDPTNKNRLFGFQIKRDEQSSKLQVAKLQMFEESN